MRNNKNSSYRNKLKFLFAGIFPILFLIINCSNGQIYKSPPPPVKPAKIEKLYTAFSKIFALDYNYNLWLLAPDDSAWLIVKRTDNSGKMDYLDEDGKMKTDTISTKYYFDIMGNLFTLKEKAYILIHSAVLVSSDTGKTWCSILKNKTYGINVACSTGLDSSMLISCYDGIYRINLNPPECKLIHADFSPQTIFKSGKIYLATTPFEYNHSSGEGEENGVRTSYIKDPAIWRSEDGGRKWEKVFELPGSTMDFGNFIEYKNIIYSNSGLISNDKGKTWAETKTDSLSDEIKDQFLFLALQEFTYKKITVKSQKGTKTYCISDGKVIITKGK